MDFTYSIWILLLPLISFLVIGLPEFVNKKYSWSHKTAGLIGTCSLGLVAALSYYTAFQYFTADRLAALLERLAVLRNAHLDVACVKDP